MRPSSPRPTIVAAPLAQARRVSLAAVIVSVSFWMVASAAQAARPVNDDLAGAASVQSAAVGTLDESTFESGEEAATGAPDFHISNWGTAWYAYTPTTTVAAQTRVVGRNGFLAKLNVFTGTSYADLSLVAGGDSCAGGGYPFQNGGCATFATTPGTTYLIQVINHNISFPTNHVFDLTVTENGTVTGTGSTNPRVLAPSQFSISSFAQGGTLTYTSFVGTIQCVKIVGNSATIVAVDGSTGKANQTMVQDNGTSGDKLANTMFDPVKLGAKARAKFLSCVDPDLDVLSARPELAGDAIQIVGTT